MLEKHYKPSAVEGEIYRQWEEAGAFKAGAGKTEGADSFCVVIPPPNVTGSLHMGHALNNTLQDILVRFARMQGKDVLWQPGTDHAGIATQMVVERQLMERQEPGRREMGREAFVERVWKWKEESGGTIIGQLKRLGASCDWSRERFTMDEGLSDAVLRVFVQLHKEGLIYRDKRLVNWDPHFETAISDLEVENKEVDGHFWHFKYPLENGETYEYVEKDEDGNVVVRETRDYISIATTRPETMLGDGAVAVHPSDERYAPIVGKRVLLPLADRYIPVITDDYPDPDFGSGAVKITGAHDFNDYQVAKRHDIPMYILMDTKAQMLDAEHVPEKYRGMDRFEARKAIVADLEERGLMIQVEDKKIMQPFGDRSGVVIEPYLTDQWFADAKTLAKPALEAVYKGDTKFIPKNWEKTYFQWLENIEPWCISRQLWWGHRIPAWYGPDLGKFGEYDFSSLSKVICAETQEDAVKQFEAYYLENNDEFYPYVFVAESKQAAEAHTFGGVADHSGGIAIYRDEDVLDTWFSSALWPFSTLGWPEETPELKRYYPTSVLVTGFDIIFFWVARMMMMGTHFMKDAPFPDVYIHALVRDEKGQKMSKSKGNVMDPLDLIDGIDLDGLIEKRVAALSKKDERKRIERDTKKDYPKGIEGYGADALRFTLAIMAAQGRDVKLSVSRIEGYRNFATKLWNAARFAEMNECVPQADFKPEAAKASVNRWIAGETERTALAIAEAIETYRFNDAASAIYQFVWHTFCDWYLELSKPILMGADEDAKIETRAMVAWTLDRIVTMLHPFMPFITEELWQRIGDAAGGRKAMLILSEWPNLSGLQDKAADEEMAWIIELISEIRSIRSEMNIPPSVRIPLIISGADGSLKTRLSNHEETVSRLARLETMGFEKTPPKGAVQIVMKDCVLALPIAGIVDLDAETSRLGKEIEKIQGEIGALDRKLADEKFISRAPEHVVEENRERLVEANAAEKRLNAALKRIQTVI
ncbi:MAG: valine--tRNA ligase [Hyphomicrobiales bacterium]|nr:valine--tRNA ligase [Hyphomicrobiales bacterium]